MGNNRQAAAAVVDEMLTPLQVAEEWQIPEKTLYAWRYRGVGPRCLKIGRHLRYRRSDLEAWLAGRIEASA